MVGRTDTNSPRAPERVALSALSPGTRFRLPHTEREGTLLYANECRARVRYHTGPTTRTVTFHQGTVDEETKELPAREREFDIAPTTMVEVLP